MPLEFRYHDPQGEDEPAVWVSLSSNSVPFGTLQLASAADLGEAATSGLEVEDPDGTWDFVGLRALTIYETSAPSNNQVILRGRTQDRTVSRGDSELTGASRVWSIDLVDYNFHLGKRIHVDGDAKRPAESAGDRLRWLLSSAAHIKLHDHGNVTYPSHSLDACDYRGQRPLDLLADCAVEGGYNFWCEWNEAHNCSELYFLDPGSTSYQSTARISNDPNDPVAELTFIPNRDARLTRSPGRIAFGVYLAYANGSVYVRNQTTKAQFADVDQAAPMTNVKREARARRLATKFLNDHDEEEDKITCSVWTPPEHVNALRAGHLVDVKFTHFPGYESFRPCRVLRRTVAQDPITGAYQDDGTFIDPDDHEGWYRIDLELTPIAPPPPSVVQSYVYNSNDFEPSSWNYTMDSAPAAGNLLLIGLATKDDQEGLLSEGSDKYTRYGTVAVASGNIVGDGFYWVYRVVPEGDSNVVTIGANGHPPTIAVIMEIAGVSAPTVQSTDSAVSSSISTSVAATGEGIVVGGVVAGPEPGVAPTSMESTAGTLVGYKLVKAIEGNHPLGGAVYEVISEAQSVTVGARVRRSTGALATCDVAINAIFLPASS